MEEDCSSFGFIPLVVSHRQLLAQPASVLQINNWQELKQWGATGTQGAGALGLLNEPQCDEHRAVICWLKALGIARKLACPSPPSLQEMLLWAVKRR